MDQKSDLKPKAKNSNILLTLDEESHQYYADGAPVPGVTHILNVLYKYPQGNDRPRRLIDASFFGKVVHRACELDDRGTLDEGSLTQNVVPYVDGWRLFKKDYNIGKKEIFLNEEKLISVMYGNSFAGTIDRVIFDMIIDIKTSASHNPLTPIQLSGYELLYNENYPDYPARKRLEILLKRNGTYSPLKHTDSFDMNMFMSALNVYNFKMVHGYAI